MKKAKIASLIAGACLLAGTVANATQVIDYTGKPVVVYLSTKTTRGITFPHRLSRIVTGINTAKLSVEQSNKTLFLKPLSKDMQGDFFVVESNGKIVHLVLKTLKKRVNLDDIRIVFPEEQAKVAVEKAKKLSPMSFLKRLVLKNFTGIDRRKPDKDINIHLTKNLSVKITSVYSTPLYKAYYGFVYNDSDEKVRLPIEEIYYKNLIGVSPGKLYLEPHERTDIYFVTYNG